MSAGLDYRSGIRNLRVNLTIPPAWPLQSLEGFPKEASKPAGGNRGNILLWGIQQLFCLVGMSVVRVVHLRQGAQRPRQTTGSPSFLTLPPSHATVSWQLLIFAIYYFIGFSAFWRIATSDWLQARRGLPTRKLVSSRLRGEAQNLGAGVRLNIRDQQVVVMMVEKFCWLACRRVVVI